MPKKIAAFLILLIFTTIANSTTFYLDIESGNDDRSGTSPQTAWQNLSKVNSLTFQPGDSILFKADGIWTGQLWPKGSGNIQKEVYIGMFGSGNKPILDGNGVNPNVIYLINQEYWTIEDLEIVNTRLSGPEVLLRGVYILGRDFGIIHRIRLSNLIIHDISGSLADKNTGGIFFEVTGNLTPTCFDSVIIENCQIYNVDRTGISNESSWANRTLTGNTNWYPSTNLIIRNNWIERIGANGLIVRVANKPLIENNIFKECGLKINGNAMFIFNCDDALVQFNESYLTVENPGDIDASGFDSDYRSKRSVFQYNYSHDNDDGFIAIVCQGGSSRFNDGTIVRYNISQNDKGEIIRVSGQTTNTNIYNNTIYMSAGVDNVIWHKSWDAWPDRTTYFNNIFYISEGRPAYNFGSSTNNSFNYNVFYGYHPSGEPGDLNKITKNPNFENPGTGGLSINSVDGYKLLSTSPCINSGLMHYVTLDYWGNSVPYNNSNIDRGAHEYQGDPTIEEPPVDINQSFVLSDNYPDPFNGETTIEFQTTISAQIDLSIFDTSGKKVKTLFHGTREAELYREKWNGLDETGRKVAAGIYYCRLKVNANTKAIKMFLF